MFNCQDCGETSKPREPAHRVVVQQRVKTYAPRYDANRTADGYTDDPGGKGLEAVFEVTVCGVCFPKYKRLPPA